MPLRPSRLVFPALRWSPESGFAHEEAMIDRALERGVGGFIIFGGVADQVAALTRRLRDSSPHPLLLGADLERGAGQQFRGCTPLPPAGAVGSLDEDDTTRRAARITAVEARSLGVPWIFAPVADVSSEPLNPIVGPRAFSPDPASAAEQVRAWTEGCLEGGGWPCVKHFPGHGRTREDSHVTLPTVEADVELLMRELAPFQAAFEAGVPSVMTAHVAYTGLDDSGLPATRSPALLLDLLRGRLGFRGLVVSDALLMEGARAGVSQEEAAVQAVAAGVDALLYPPAPEKAVAALEVGVREGRLSTHRVAEANGRIQALAERASFDPAERTGWGHPADVAFAADVARRAVRLVGSWDQGSIPAGGAELILVDDDLGGPFPPPSREPLVSALRALGVTVHAESAAEVDAGSGAEVDTPQRWVAVFADTRGWKGRAGLSDPARRRLADLAVTPAVSLFLLFGDPHWIEQLPGGVPVVCAWGGEELMQRAAAEVVTGRRIT